jgi:YHS domain-containing protein
MKSQGFAAVCRVCVVGLAGFWLAQLWAADPAAKQDEHAAAKAASQEALEEFNGLIGHWRGAAQPVRNSNKGAWIEKAEWVWELKKDSAALRYLVNGGKLLKSAALTYDPAAKVYHLQATLSDQTSRDYVGKLDGNKLVLESAADKAGRVHRLTVTQLNDKRTLVLLEERPSENPQFSRVVEVGYTREGTSLAVEGAGEPECIVSGGKGTMSTVYKGQTYWFCCTGCRDAFNDDPEGIIAEAAARAAKKKAAAKK